MLELKNASKTYRMGDVTVTALEDCSLTIEPGDFVAIMGPSGSGKSTLMNLLGLLDTPDSGDYFVEGRPVKQLVDNDLAELRGLTIGFIFQQFHLLPHLSALENVVLPQLYTRTSFIREEARELLQQVGLGSRLDHRPSELSGGQQQRVAIARSMINKPLLILADEPTGNLDSRSEKEILDYLRALNAEGVTIVIVTHEETVGRQAKRLIRMRDGKISADDRLQPYSPHRRARYAKQKLAWLTWNRLRASCSLQLKQALANLKGHKLRTFLSTIGITIGVASVVTMMSLGNAMKANIDKQMSSLGRHMILVEPGRPKKAGQKLATGEVVKIEIEVIDEIKNSVAGVKRVVPIVQDTVRLEYGAESQSVKILGVTQDFFKLHHTKAKSGYLFGDEVGTNDRIALIGEQLADDMFIDQDPIGEIIKVNDNPYEIIGVIENPGTISMFNERQSLILPIGIAMQRIRGLRTIDLLEIEAEPNVDLDQFGEKVRDSLSLFYNVPIDMSEEAFSIANLQGEIKTVENVGRSLSLFLGVLASISLFVGGIGIMNIMLVTVAERTREIGLRKAIGAKQSAVFLQFLLESKIVCLIGGIFGIGLAWAACLIMSQFTEGMVIDVSPSTIALATGFSIAIGLLSGIYPARRAAKLNPIAALRTV